MLYACLSRSPRGDIFLTITVRNPKRRVPLLDLFKNVSRRKVSLDQTSLIRSILFNFAILEILDS